jgi:Leucine-rich repeat (LRR) protein
MTHPTSPDTRADGANGSDNPLTRLAQLRALLEAGTANPAQAREAVPELMALAAGSNRAEALDLAVRFSAISDCSTQDLLLLWATADGDPHGFCEDFPAPAYRSRKAIRLLVGLSTPGDGGQALRLAARFVPEDRYASKFLLRMWRNARDPEGFAEYLLAPAFRQEGRTELRLRYASSLSGLRHLTMLEELELHQCGEITDLTEVGELTGLTSLGLEACRRVEDLAPLGRLTRLTSLTLSQCDAVEDFEPLLRLDRLRKLTLHWVKVSSVRGFGQAFPDLESLDLRFCRSLRDIDGLVGLPRLTHLQLSDLDELNDLSPFAAFPRLESLVLSDCAKVSTLEGLGDHPRLKKLGIHTFPELRTLAGLGEPPALRDVRLTGCPLSGLDGLGRLPALRTLMINGTAVRDLGGLRGSPLRTLTLLYMKELESLASLQDCPDLRELEVRDCPLVEEIAPDHLRSLALSGARWADPSHLTGLRGLRTLEVGTAELEDIAPLTVLPHLTDLDLSCCRSVKDLGPLLAMPSLTRVRLASGIWFSGTSGAPDPVVTELKARGVTVALDR